METAARAKHSHLSRVPIHCVVSRRSPVTVVGLGRDRQSPAAFLSTVQRACQPTANRSRTMTSGIIFAAAKRQQLCQFGGQICHSNWHLTCAKSGKVVAITIKRIPAKTRAGQKRWEARVSRRPSGRMPACIRDGADKRPGMMAASRADGAETAGRAATPVGLSARLTGHSSPLHDLKTSADLHRDISRTRRYRRRRCPSRQVTGAVPAGH